MRWLQELADQLELNLYFDSIDAGGGDPLSIVEKSAKLAARNERFKGRYNAKLVLLDEDRIGQAKARDAAIEPLAKRHALTIIFQRYDHEALLLRHIPNCSRLKPPRGASNERLLKHWHDYRKPASFAYLQQRIGHNSLVQVCKTEHQLACALRALGFVL